MTINVSMTYTLMSLGGRLHLLSPLLSALHLTPLLQFNYYTDSKSALMQQIESLEGMKYHTDELLKRPTDAKTTNWGSMGSLNEIDKLNLEAESKKIDKRIRELKESLQGYY